jgi:hypothetical protein
MAEDNPTSEAMLKDLELQWRDHFHMRDQTWKTLSNSVLLFLGVIALEIKGIDDFVMVPAYAVVILTALFGWIVATHHRARQHEKFAFIQMYEERLALYPLKKNIIESGRSGAVGRIFTAVFVRWMHLGIGIVAILLLVRRIVLTA